MRMLATWEQGDALSCHVCLLLSPPEWRGLRTAHRRFGRHLAPADMHWLFNRRLQARVDGSAALGAAAMPEERSLESLTPILSLASAVEVVAEILEDVTAYPHLVDHGLAPVRQVLGRLHGLALRDRQLMPRERSGRRSSLLRRLLRSFAALNGLMPRLVALLRAFPPYVMPPDVFVTVCEVLASLIHNAKESKRSFVTAGGLACVLGFLRARPRDAATQAAGLAALLALSARSVLCIRFMVDAGAHEIVAVALQSFPSNTKVVARATGLLANMSNVPCVCPALQRCGVLKLAQELLGEEEPSSPFVRDFVQYLLSNLQEHDAEPGGAELLIPTRSNGVEAYHHASSE